MLKIKQKISFILVFIILYLFTNSVSFAEDLILSEPTAILVEMETGQVLYEKKADMKWSPASTTKIMTAIVAIKNSALDTKMKASTHAIRDIPSDYGLAGIQPDEIMTLNDLLNFSLIISANEASNVIAENISPTQDIDGFVALMNQEAQELGLGGTHFTNTYGLEQENHFTTARDLSIIARKAMEFPIFREIVSKKVVPLPDTNLKKSDDWDKWHIESTNKLLNSNSEYYTKVTGIKTGYTSKAGRCLVFSAVNDRGLELVGVILGAQNNDILFKEAKDLLEYGYRNYEVQTLVSSGEFFGRYEVIDSMDNIPVDLQTLGEVTHLLPTSPEQLEKDVTVKETLNTPYIAPIEKGQVLGYKTWFYQGEEIGSVQLIAANDIEKTMAAKIRDRFQELIKDKTVRVVAFIVIVLILFLIILRIILRGVSRRRNYHHRHFRM
jgi:D-alanyl-D-alanine carboxypeptidase (penicillin-binding protein 5/6)